MVIRMSMLLNLFVTFLKPLQMTNRKFLFPILLCTICIILFPACQQQESGLNDFTKDDPAISSRSECDPCGDDCCCGVELDDDTNAVLQICGTTSGGTTCVTVSGNCFGQIDGTLETIFLNNSNPKHVFCMKEFNALRIINQSLSDNAKIRIGCNTVAFVALEFDIAPQDSIKLDALTDCELAGDCS
jgi:hypothetical protein